jgi:3',5'-cyclic AMP phosphodiesterase CpdA
LRIVHISDIHVCLPRRWQDIRGKRWAGWLNWVARRYWHHCERRYFRLLERLMEDPPDVLAITGDIAQLGTVAEMRRAAAPLKRLADRGVDILYVPGNHDRYITGDEAAREVVADLCGTYGGGHEPVEGIRLLRLEERLGPVEFVLLSQAVPCPLTVAGGRMSEEQWAYLEHMGPTDGVRLVLGHYPVVIRLGKLLPRERALDGAERLPPVLAHMRASAYLCGHVHRHYEKTLAGGCGQLVAGSVTHTNTGWVIESDGASCTWTPLTG